MQLLGKSLEDLFGESKEKHFSIKTTCNLGYQMINLLEFIHNKHVIHRDVKPDNFVMGLNQEQGKVYLIDFGLAKKYRSSRTLKHCPMTNKKKLTGTARYASINALKGIEQSRRDDLESLGYVLLYFLRGSLPWQGLPITNKEDRYIKILEQKKTTTPLELCKGYPKQFQLFIQYTRELGYEEEPNYQFLRTLMTEATTENGSKNIDTFFEWNNIRDDFETKKASQITVVNNYYHNVNNIVINKNMEEEKIEEQLEDKIYITPTFKESKEAIRNSNTIVNDVFNSNIVQNDLTNIINLTVQHNTNSINNIEETIELKGVDGKRICCCMLF